MFLLFPLLEIALTVVWVGNSLNEWAERSIFLVFLIYFAENAEKSE